MSVSLVPRSNDPRLAALLSADTDAGTWRAIEQLLDGEISSIIRDTVSRRLGRSHQAADHIDDVVGEVRLKLTQKFWSLRAGAGEPIENLGAYCVTTSEHVCYGFLRRQFPERTRLRNRLRYALTHHPAMTLEADLNGVWRCQSTALRRPVAPGATQALLDSPRDFVARLGVHLSAPLPAVVERLLSACENPVEFDRFVEVMATLLGVHDAPPVTNAPDAQSSDRLEQIPDRTPGIQEVLEQRTSLLDVWQELVALPVRQRVAVLLNLRDPEGGAILQMLPATGVVTMAEIAAALGVSDVELHALWDALPLDDLSIAGRLGVTRQQVINLRKSGRARLARRVR